MKYTQNYSLRKPEDTDPADIQDLNFNADAIDGKLKEIEDWEAAHLQASNPHSITPALIGAETPTGAQQKANQAETNAKSYADDVLESANSHTDQVGSDLSQKLNETRIKVLDVEQDVSNISKVLTNLNPNQEAKQSVSGYGILSLPKNAANGQVSVSVNGLTWSNKLVVANIASTITDNAGNRLKIKKDGSAGVKTAYDTTDYKEIDFISGHKYFVVFKIKENSVGKIRNNIRIHYSDETTEGISLYTDVFKAYNIIQATKTLKGQIYTSSSTTAVGDKYFEYAFVYDLTELGLDNLTLEQADKLFYYINGTKSTVCAGRLKSVGKNLFDFKNKGIKTTDYSVDLGDRYRGLPIQLSPHTTYTVQRFMNGFKHDASYVLDLWHQQGQILNLNVHSTTDAYTTFTTDNSGLIYLRHRYATNDKLIKILKQMDIMLQTGTQATGYEPYTETNAYVVAKDSEGNIAELRSLPNGTKDEVRLSEGKLIKRIGDKTNVASGTVIDYSDMTTGGQFVAYASDGTSQVGVKGDTLTITATTLTYQLATPIEIPIQTSGSLVSCPSGTVYIEPFVADAGIYTDKMEVLYSDLPIKAIEKVSKVDFMTGVETELDIDGIVIAENKLSFTHPDLEAGDIVFFVYEYDRESTVGETEIEYYDSRYVIKDSVTEKFYKWHIAVADGVPSIELTEV